MKTAKTFLFLLLALSASHARVDIFAFGSLGEAPYRPASDIGQSIAVPQLGLQAAWTWRYGGPFLDVSLGRYYSGGLYEAFLGLQAGVDIWKVRPSLSVGYGVQSVNRKKYLYFESDDHVFVRETYFPLGMGMRLDLFDWAFMELDSRYQGYPWWTFEVGWRLARW